MSGAEFAFIPKPLSIADRPELSAFPVNVLFGQRKPHKYLGWLGLTEYQTATYLPDLASYSKKDGLSSMNYYNDRDRHFWLRIDFRQTENAYSGRKFNGFNLLTKSFGFEWRQFFVHLTMAGLADGE